MGEKSLDFRRYLRLNRDPDGVECRPPETVVVAQLVEPLIVVQVVAGSSPVIHPNSLFSRVRIHFLLGLSKTKSLIKSVHLNSLTFP